MLINNSKQGTPNGRTKQPLKITDYANQPGNPIFVGKMGISGRNILTIGDTHVSSRI